MSILTPENDISEYYQVREDLLKEIAEWKTKLALYKAWKGLQEQKMWENTVKLAASRLQYANSTLEPTAEELERRCEQEKEFDAQYKEDEELVIRYGLDILTLEENKRKAKRELAEVEQIIQQMVAVEPHVVRSLRR